MGGSLVTKLEVIVTDHEAPCSSDKAAGGGQSATADDPGALRRIDLAGFWGRMGPRGLRIAAALTLLICFAAPARSELPPWVYGDDQRQAPVLVEIQLERSQARGPLQLLRARLLRIRRQPEDLLLRPGDLIEIAFSRPPQRPLGWAGPSPIPVLPIGRRVLAWLTPLPADATITATPTPTPTATATATATADLRRFAPAAGGRSFGPSLEDVLEPISPGRKSEPGQSPGS